MIKTYKLPKPVAVMVIAVFLAIAGYLLYARKVETQKLVNTAFSGKIIVIEHAGRGSMKVLLENEQEPYILSGFAKYEGDLKIGDSLSKTADSDEIYCYKRNKSGGYYLLDVFNIR